MKNIEKYPNTRDALKAYAAHRKSEGLPFEEWLDREYVELREPTLLEAAEKVIEFLYKSKYENHSISYDDIDKLEAVLKREKRKPVRNFDMYATAKEAYRAFRGMCKCCSKCQMYKFGTESTDECAILWLYEAAGAGKEEKAK